MIPEDLRFSWLNTRLFLGLSDLAELSAQVHDVQFASIRGQ